MRSRAAVENYPEWPNLAAMMFARARQWPNRPMLRAAGQGGGGQDGAGQSISWGEFARLAAAAARGLREAGVSAGDRVVLVSENRPEYPIAETALLAIRAVPVPTYVTNTVEDHAHVLRDSGARVAIVSTAALAERVAAAGPLDLLVTLGDQPAPPGGSRSWRALSWQALTAGASRPASDIAAEAEIIPGGSLACIIYTSGTGGQPKGVMLSHRAMLSNCHGAFELVAPLRLADEVYLSFLPLSHSYEHTVGQYFLLSIGTEIVYSRGVEHLAADMLAVRPTIMAMVPRLLEAIRTRILAQVAREPAWKQALFHRAMRYGEARAQGARLSPAAWLADRALDRLVRRKIRARFGGRFRVAISGSARLDPEVGGFFRALGINLLQGYGQTEAGPVISATPPQATRIETVGRPLRGVELRIADDGEILVRGDLVMEGYWGRPAETQEVLRDGWLHTGDVGVVDGDGNLRITDRKKDLIVLSGGDNIAPAKVEAALSKAPEIAQAVVFGDGQASLAALLVVADGCDERAVSAAVARVNTQLAAPERVRRHRLVPPFSVENSLLTPTQKIKRRQVLATHAGLVGELSGGAADFVRRAAD